MSDHQPSVIDHQLAHISPTAIEAHERCNRRYWFARVDKREDPAGPAAKDGATRHDRLEKYLKGEATIVTLQAPERELLRFLPEPRTVGARYEIPIEDIGLAVEGVPVIGRIDLINDSGTWIDNEGISHPMEPNEIEVHDHKFTSGLEWAKTPNQLANTFQMNLYAKAVLSLRNVIDKVRVSHGYSQTKRKVAALKVTKVLTVPQIDLFWAKNVVPAVRLMKHTAMQTDYKSVQPNFDSCNSFGKPCPFMGLCHSDILAMIIGGPVGDAGTEPAKPNTNVTGGNTMSLLSKFSAQSETLAPVVPESFLFDDSAGARRIFDSVLPPDAPPSDPVLAKAGAEGQFHKNAVGLYVVKDGQWTLAGAKSKADYAALVENGSSVTAGGAPAIAKAPDSVFENTSVVKRGRGRPKKVTEFPVGAPLPASVGLNELPVDGMPVKQPVPEPSGIMLFVNCIPSISECKGLEGYIEMITSRIASNTNSADIRASDHEALKFGKFRGVLAAAVRQNPPPPGAYRILGRSELYDIVIEALAPMCYLLVRGVGA